MVKKVVDNDDWEQLIKDLEYWRIKSFELTELIDVLTKKYNIKNSDLLYKKENYETRT